MRARLAILAVTTVAGFGALGAAPAFATTQVDVSVCDSLATSVQPGGCVAVSTIPLTNDSLSGAPVSFGAFCDSAPGIPTVTSYCIYQELDQPS